MSWLIYFFYREPEESKEQQEEDLAVAPEYPVDYGAGALGLDAQWSGQIPDAQWNADIGAPVIPAVPAAVGWTPDVAPTAGGDGWDAAAAPAMAPPATGWE